MKKYFRQYILLLLFILGVGSACQEENYVPKPKAYPRVILPEAAYQPYQSSDCPFVFEYPRYARIIKDTLFFNRAPENPCWLDIFYPDFAARIHVSYKALNGKQDAISQYIKDAYKLNAKHFIKADYSEDSLIVTPSGATGIIYDVGGDAASPTQFYLTDSSQHFIWASLYFNNVPNEDSIAPIAQFIRGDIVHLLESFKWQ